VPRLYAWKSAKWARAVDRAGFWEGWANGGYHLRGDPWAEQRFREGERFEGRRGRRLAQLTRRPISRS
jgi:DMSO/TMAO reductase YedYZ molybdopterin-dependent catalytic subunit